MASGTPTELSKIVNNLLFRVEKERKQANNAQLLVLIKKDSGGFKISALDLSQGSKGNSLPTILNGANQLVPVSR